MTTSLAPLVAAFQGHVPEPEAVAVAVCEAIQAKLVEGAAVHLGPIGSFTVTTREAFAANHPQTGAETVIPTARIPVFRAAAELKVALGNPGIPASTPKYTPLVDLPKATWAAMTLALTHELAARLGDKGKVHFGPLGEMTVSMRRTFATTNAMDGSLAESPAHKIPVFRASKALKKALGASR